MKLHLATLVTQPLETQVPGQPAEGGVFEIEVWVDDLALRKSGAPKTYFFRELAVHLQQAMLDTGVPREYWWAQFTQDAQIMFNLPAVVNMEKG